LEIAVRIKRLLVVVGLASACAALSVHSVSHAQIGAAPQQLSFTVAQVANGEAEYKTSCIDCHGPNLNDGEFGGPPLKGDAFTAKWFKMPAGALVGYVHAAMPPDGPGRLPMGTYVEIVAYILSVNGVPSGTREMPSDMTTLGALYYPPQKKNQAQ
jgi:mono/diheme cytochrome c family protein